jgi:hypothetical protein
MPTVSRGMFAALVVVATASSLDAGAAAKKKPKAALTCASTAIDGTRVVLGKGKWRLENPVGCLVTLTAPDDQAVYVAEVWTEYQKWDDAASKSVPVKTDTRTGEISYWADAQKSFAVTLAPGDGPPQGGDYVPCVDFTVMARVYSPETMWTGKLAVKQFCPD